MVHRIADFLEHAESLKSEPAVITKDVPNKNVKRGGVILGSVFFGRWQWTPAGEGAFDVPCRQHAEQWAIQE